MLQGLEEIREQDGFLHVRLRREEDFDPYIYEQIRMDEECLQPLQQQKHTFRYELGGLLSLSCFLEQYRFERAEGYCFLIQLLEHIVRVNRNKPVVMDVRYIYLPPQGNFFRFLCVPLNVEHWYLQKEECREFAQYLAGHFQTQEAYEIIGFLVRSVHGPEFSLTALLQGVLILRELYTPKQSFWQRLRTKSQKQTFAARIEVLSKADALAHVEEPSQTKPPAINLEKTSVLGMPVQKKACLQSDTQTFWLQGISMEIGREQDCEICLDSAQVSKRHLRLRCEQGRWYARDLRSRNGSTLNGKRMQREMRLREGMVLMIADRRFVFHEASG